MALLTFDCPVSPESTLGVMSTGCTMREAMGDRFAALIRKQGTQHMESSPGRIMSLCSDSQHVAALGAAHTSFPVPHTSYLLPINDLRKHAAKHQAMQERSHSASLSRNSFRLLRALYI